jgi:hypothetical protein
MAMAGMPHHGGMSMDAAAGPFAEPIAGSAPAPATTTTWVTSIQAKRGTRRVRRFRLVARDYRFTEAHPVRRCGSVRATW